MKSRVTIDTGEEIGPQDSKTKAEWSVLRVLLPDERILHLHQYRVITKTCVCVCVHAQLAMPNG